MKKFLSIIKEYIGTVIIAIVLAILLVNFVFMSVQVKQTSMIPILHDGDRGISFICSRYFGVNRFDIVVIKTDNKLLVKRAIGLPGETVEYKDNILYVNGKEVEEDYLDEDVHTSDFSVKLGDDEYYCLGDNREHSSDSRTYGAFKNNQIKSTHIFVFYPFKNFGYKG